MLTYYKRQRDKYIKLVADATLKGHTTKAARHQKEVDNYIGEIERVEQAKLLEAPDND